MHKITIFLKTGKSIEISIQDDSETPEKNFGFDPMGTMKVKSVTDDLIYCFPNGSIDYYIFELAKVSVISNLTSIHRNN